MRKMPPNPKRYSCKEMSLCQGPEIRAWFRKLRVHYTRSFGWICGEPKYRTKRVWELPIVGRQVKPFRLCREHWEYVVLEKKW